jgi:hypothetical protein
MRRWLSVAALLGTAAACDNPRDVAAPTRLDALAAVKAVKGR